MSGKNPSEYAIRKAQEAGHLVVVTKENRLLLDLDGKPAIEALVRVIPVVQEKYLIDWDKSWACPSQTEGHFHAMLFMAEGERELDMPERFFLQAVLGSDRKRELLGWIWRLADDPTPSLLVITKDNWTKRVPMRQALGHTDRPHQHEPFSAAALRVHKIIESVEGLQ